MTLTLKISFVRRLEVRLGTRDRRISRLQTIAICLDYVMRLKKVEGNITNSVDVST